MASARSAVPRTPSPISTTSGRPSQLRVGVRGGHRGVLRPDRPHGPHGPSARPDRGQACPGVGDGVLAGRSPLRGRPQQGHDHRHTPRWDPLAAAANIALSVLDEHFAAKWEALGPAWTRAKRRRSGEPAMRLVRYADDFVVMVAGTGTPTGSGRRCRGRTGAPCRLSRAGCSGSRTSGSEGGRETGPGAAGPVTGQAAVVVVASAPAVVVVVSPPPDVVVVESPAVVVVPPPEPSPPEPSPPASPPASLPPPAASSSTPT